MNAWLLSFACAVSALPEPVNELGHEEGAKLLSLPTGMAAGQAVDRTGPTGASIRPWTHSPRVGHSTLLTPDFAASSRVEGSDSGDGSRRIQPRGL